MDAPEIPVTELWLEIMVWDWIALVSIDFGDVPVDGPETPEFSEDEAIETLVALEVVGTPADAPPKPNPREISIPIPALLELLGSAAALVVAAETPTRT